ncbi:aspartate phosphatase [Thiocapsa bogorovii]|uniref:aspartate phosphatase n=1 Tax=Thiocapsa bogorovii TaxID=521689 RepID=UPI001E4AB5C1|nr:aspartate phosphatase [Thiocapsa bogorovii]UHD15909.1 aspartate phosphatase [Thiocapsa bogorovii]
MGSDPRLPAVLSPTLRRVLALLGILFGLLAVNSVYLVAVTAAEWVSGEILENRVYLLMFLLHLLLGLILVVPLVLFGVLHLRRAWRRPNRWAVRVGFGLFVMLLLLILSGILLTRFGFFEINHPGVRSWAYWIHVTTPLIALWLFVLHRLAGPPLRWRPLVSWASAALVFASLAVGFHLIAVGQGDDLVRSFQPALARVQSGGPIRAERLMQDEVCAECHADIAAQHAGSVHRLSSFNNPIYRFSVEETRRVLLERDGAIEPARLCAVCHDPVPLFSGRFDDPHYDPDMDPGAQAGITCLTCHAITEVNSPRGNGDYSLVVPPAYPFADSDHALFKAINRQLIRAKPAFHKKTLLKPLHRSPEFCSTCHKVHLPEVLNRYRWLRGQNHYDSFLLSGVSGHRVDSFYYPDRATGSCNTCHMPPKASDDPAARVLADSGPKSVRDHLFAAANTAVPALLGRPPEENAARVVVLERAARVDIFGLREGATIDGPLLAPIRPALPRLEPGRRYLLELVVRNLGVGHELTQGTTDSNELWLDVILNAGERLIGRSGARAADGTVDPGAYFVNAYILDRDGNRIDRRNVQDVFVALYDHQIPPGAATVVQYALRLPDDLTAPVTVDAALRYRKFDTGLYRHLRGSEFRGNDLPIVTLAADSVTLPIQGGVEPTTQTRDIPVWQRWNDYGIGLLRQGRKGRLRQAAEAFAVVESLRPGDGAMNLARVFYEEGRLDDAADALQRAAASTPPAAPWTMAWYGALIERDLGHLDAAIANLEALAETRFGSARARGFDFSRDYRMLNELGRTLYERARQARGPSQRAERSVLLERAAERFEQALAEDPESAASHHGLSLVYAELDRPDSAAEHRRLHETYRPDDQAIQRAVTLHRSRNPTADHAAEPIAIYDLQRPESLAWAGDGGFVAVSGGEGDVGTIAGPSPLHGYGSSRVSYDATIASDAEPIHRSSVSVRSP